MELRPSKKEADEQAMGLFMSKFGADENAFRDAIQNVMKCISRSEKQRVSVKKELLRRLLI